MSSPPRGGPHTQVVNYNIEHADGHSRAFQGSVEGGFDMTQCTPAASSDSFHSGSDDPQNRHAECQRCRTWREKDEELRRRCVSTHKGTNEEWPNNAYFNLADRDDRETVRPGCIYRVWQPGNSVMHRSTVLVMIDRRRSMSVCKIEKGANVDKRRNWEHYWAPLHIHTTADPCHRVNRHEDQAECHELAVLPDKNQTLEKSCWVELERSYDIGNGDDYCFVYCGKLDNDSFDYARRKHRGLYSNG